jgi:hypothetical protein
VTDAAGNDYCYEATNTVTNTATGYVSGTPLTASQLTMNCYPYGVAPFTALPSIADIVQVQLLLASSGTAESFTSFCLDDIKFGTGDAAVTTDTGSTATDTGPTSDAGTPTAPVCNSNDSGTLTGQYVNDKLTNGGYRVQSNWNNTANTTYPSETFTCTSMSISGNVQSSGCSTSGAPCGYPSVYVGTNTYGNVATSGPLAAPKLISSIVSIPTSWSISGTTTAYDASYDLFFGTSSSFDTSGPTGGEMMIWFAHSSNVTPIGTFTTTFTDAGVTWNVYVGSGSGKQVVSFVATSSVSSLTFNLLDFITKATTVSTITTSEYLESIFTGFEVWQGGNGLSGSNFAVTVN